MSLSGQQRKKLANALIDAFPTTASLEQMLLYELDKSLRVIAGEGSLQEIVFRLIQAADSQGWHQDLVHAAFRENPGNSELAAVALELLREKFVSPNILSSSSSQLISNNKESEVDVDYTALKEFTQQKKFKEADFETTRIILWIANQVASQVLTGEDLQDFPLLDLNTIDKLWLTGSNNKFGFSIQKQLWIENSYDIKYYNYQDFNSFAKKMDWNKDNIPCDLRAKKGYLPKGIYYVTRKRTEEIREKYLREYNESINKLLEEERNQRRIYQKLVERSISIGGVFDGGSERVERHGGSIRAPDPYFLFFQRLCKLNA